MTLPLVEVEWTDAAGGSGWTSIRDTREKAKLDMIRSVGFLIIDDDVRVAIVQSASDRLDEDGEPESVNDWLAIPRENVRHITRLRD